MMYDVVIIGAGPAGISAGIYAASRGKKVLITEKNTVGGLIGKVSTVTHYAGIMTEETGSSFAKRLKIQAENTGIDIIYEEVTQPFNSSSNSSYSSALTIPFSFSINGAKYSTNLSPSFVASIWFSNVISKNLSIKNLLSMFDNYTKKRYNNFVHSFGVCNGVVIGSPN